MPVALETLDGDFVAHPGDHDLAPVGLGCAVHRQQVLVENTGVSHAHAFHPQQIVRPWSEQGRINAIFLLDILLRQYRAACGHAPDQRQRSTLRGRQSRPGQGGQADAARQPGLHPDDAFFLEGA